MIGHSKEDSAKREDLKDLLEMNCAVLAQKRLALQGELMGAAEALAISSPKGIDSHAFERASKLVAHLETQLERMKQAIAALEQVFRARARLDRIATKLDALETGPAEVEPEVFSQTLAEPAATDSDVSPDEADTSLMPEEGVIDLQNAMVQRQRRQVEGLREERSVLIIIGPNTLASMIYLHQAVLGFLTASSYQNFLERLNLELPHTIDIPVIVLRIERKGRVAVTPEFDNIRLLAEGKVADLFGPQQSLLLRRDVTSDRDLYSGRAKEVCSDALVRLDIPAKNCEGMLALGAGDPDCFSDDQGTEPPTFLGRSIETLIEKWSV